MKSLHILAVFGWIMLEAVSPPHAADPPALNENLKPLERGLGQWSYQWKDEKGRESTSYLTATVACAGNLIVARDQTIKDGKVMFASITLSYWQPESKSIASCYFDSLGIQANSVLTQWGDRQVWQGCGYDAKGKCMTAMSTVEFQDANTFVSQLTHVVVDGKPQPDTQRWISTRVNGVLLPSSAKPPSLNSRLKVLARNLGEWSYVWPTDGGEVLNGMQSHRVEAGGAATSCEGLEIDKNGKVVFSYFFLKFWQEQTKSIGGVWVDSEAGHSFATLTKQGKKIMSQGHGYDGKGIFGTSLTSDEIQADGTRVVQSNHIIRKGEVKPDDQKVILTRRK